MGRQKESIKKSEISGIIKEITDDKELDRELSLWLSQLQAEIEKVRNILHRRGDDEMLGYFLRRLAQYKIEYPKLGRSGDFELIKRIILAEIRLDELESSSLDELSENPKLIDAFTRLHTQLQKDIEALGATSKLKKKSDLDELRVMIDYKELESSSTESDLEWLECKDIIALPE